MSSSQTINSSRNRVSNLERHPGQGRGHQPDNNGSDTDEENRVADDRASEDMTGMEDHNQTVKNLVRYALACEYQRSNIKRTGITERVIGKQRCSFKQIFQEAQEQLRNRFGMEMVELPARQKVTIREKKAAQKMKGNSKSSTAYILKSILPSKYRNTDIMPPPSHKSSSDEAAYMGLYTVIICLISLSADGQMANHQLDKYLKRLNIDRNTGIGTTSELLARMKKENYLQEYKTQDEEGQTSEWRVGPRGLVEVNSEAIIGFVQMIYGSDAPEDLLQRLQRSLGHQVPKD